MTYVDGFVLPVPKGKIKVYQKMAKAAGKMWKKHGALQYFECAGDDLFPKMHPGFKPVYFTKIARAKANETVVFAFIVFKSKAHRNAVNSRVMKDPKMNDPAWKDKPMPFDWKKMAYGGFKTIVQE